MAIPVPNYDSDAQARDDSYSVGAIGRRGHRRPNNTDDSVDVRGGGGDLKSRSAEDTGDVDNLLEPRPASRPVAPPLLLSITEAARMLSIGRSKAYELVSSGQLESVHIGRATRVPVDAVAAFVQQLRQPHPGA